MTSYIIRIADTARINHTSDVEALGPSEKTKRTRKSVKRGRTGCVTCKIRRVKCDGMVTPALRLKELILTEPTSTKSCAGVLHRRENQYFKDVRNLDEV
jgi:hypothetical protein